MKKRIIIPAVLAVAVLAPGCERGDPCKRCYLETFYYDAAPSDADAGPPPECPTCIDKDEACPVGCAEPPVV